MGLFFWRVFRRPCDVTAKRMAPMEGTNWAKHDLELFPLLAILPSISLIPEGYDVAMILYNKNDFSIGM